MPPLRERVEDLPELAKFFLRRCNTKFRKNVATIEAVCREGEPLLSFFQLFRQVRGRKRVTLLVEENGDRAGRCRKRRRALAELG